MKTATQAYNEIKAIRNSNFSQLERSYAHMINANTSEQTDAMKFGSAFHCLALEGDSFYEEYFIVKPYDARTKEGKAIRDEMLSLEQTSGKIGIKEDEYLKMCQMKESLLKHPLISEILKESLNESSRVCQIAGVDCKAKIDICNKGHVFDLKTCEDASESGFKRSIGKYMYHRQAAFYLDVAKKSGLLANTFSFIAIEKSAPHYACVYTLDDGSIEAGRLSYLSLLEKVKDAEKNPEKENAYPEGFNLISAPNWCFSVQ